MTANAGEFSPAFVVVLAVFWNICGSFFSGKCCCFGGFLEHLREFFLRKMLLFWWFFGTFAGKFPAFVAVLAVFWNICGSFFSGKCCCFGCFLEHLRENFRRLLLCDDLLSRSIARAKATRSVSLLKLKARYAFNASSIASALPARA